MKMCMGSFGEPVHRPVVGRQTNRYFLCVMITQLQMNQVAFRSYPKLGKLCGLPITINPQAIHPALGNCQTQMAETKLQQGDRWGSNYVTKPAF